MTKLNQVLAIEKDAGNKRFRLINAAYKTLQKPAAFQGLARTYAPLNEDDQDTFPPETTVVQYRAEELFNDILAVCGEHFDVVATRDFGNTVGKANVVVGEEVVLHDVPVTTLLFLEKQLVDLRTLIATLPTLPVNEQWKWDGVQGIYRTEETVKTRTKKVPRNHVKSPATDKHPAQVDVYHEDIPVGRWTSTSFSGAMEPRRVAALLERADALLRAVKMAREEANSYEIPDVKIGEAIIDYLAN